MQRVATYGFGNILPSADMDSIQDNVLGMAQVPGVMVGLPYVYCADGTNIIIGGVTGLTTTANANDNLSSGEVTFTTSSLASHTRYYGFAHDNAGTLEYVIFDSGTATPAANLVFRASNTQYRYLFTFSTNGSGHILPFRKVGNRVIYQRSASITSSSDFEPTMSGTATTYTDVDLSAWLPPHSRLVVLEGQFTVAAFGDTVDLITQGDTGSFTHQMRGNATSDILLRTIEMVTSSTQKISYKVSSGASLILRVNGFVE